VVGPLTTEDVAIAGQAGTLWATLEDLIAHAARAVSESLRLAEPLPYDASHWAISPTVGPASDRGISFFLERDVAGQEPSFKVGFFCLGDDAIALADDYRLIDRLRAGGLGVADKADDTQEISIWREVSLDAIVLHETLNDQRTFFAEQAVAFFTPVLDGDLEALVKR
jgi:hypothetical protein